MKLTIFLLLKNTIDLFFSEHKLYEFPQSDQTKYRKLKFTFPINSLCGPLFSRNAEKTHTDVSILQAFLLYPKKRLANL